MRHIHRLLQQCLDQAIRDGLIRENPAKAFHYRRPTTVKANVMTPLEMEDYLDTAERLGYLPMFMHPATQKPYSPQMVRRMHNEIIQEAGIDHIRYVDLRHTCAIIALKNGTDAKELAQMLGHYRPTITRQNYEPYLPHRVQKDEDTPNEATQDELQQAANILDNLLKF